MQRGVSKKKYHTSLVGLWQTDCAGAGEGLAGGPGPGGVPAAGAREHRLGARGARGRGHL